jgi:hypothetical protein
MVAAVSIGAAACGFYVGSSETSGRFASDLAFLRQHTNVVVLTDGTAQVAVAPQYQGRVMTSTTGGADAPSFGWIGRDTIASDKRQPHMNVFGGEDRFWLGPEGGQYALYFKKGDPFDLDHWQVPEAFDWGAWDTTETSPTSVGFRKRMALTNYSGTPFQIDVARTVRLLSDAEIATHLDEAPADGVRAVAFESQNTVTNTGDSAWKPESGLVSVWILGMFTPSPSMTIVLPYAGGTSAPDARVSAANEPRDRMRAGQRRRARARVGEFEGRSPSIVNDKYFGKVPPDRLKVTNSAVLFKADGQYRAKIGLPPSRAMSAAGSYDAANHVLTIVQYTRPADATRYVNSMWEMQREPYKGDVLNSYNDGPPAPGKAPLGPFCEIESSSPALELAPGQHYTHVHRTIHLVGPEADLDRIARRVLKISLAEVTAAFGR